MSDKKNLLPPGWDCKYDESNGKCYYVNYLTKAMQLQDPRMNYSQLQNDSTESIAMQPMHGSPYHVYPVNNFTAVKAFQGLNSSAHSISGSPLLSTGSQMTMEMPLMPNNSSPNTKIDIAALNRRKSIPMQETSFTNQIETNAVVTKIQTMFPTAGENHIRLLLKKYYNREAVVISALQVEKHPLCTPGPFTTPPIQRHLFNQSNSAFQLTPPTRRFDYFSRSGSPMPNSISQFRPSSIKSGLVGYIYGSPKFTGEQIRNSPKPHSSPKMKLRYMKNIFPKADETLLLDILANSDNNVQKASETLSSMGYTKRDYPLLSNQQRNESNEKLKFKKVAALPPKDLTEEEKEKVKTQLQGKFPKITERIVSMALESVSYSEDRAAQILKIVQQEDDERVRKDGNILRDFTNGDQIPDTTNASLKESLKEPVDTIGKDQLNKIEKDPQQLQQLQNSKSSLTPINSSHNTNTTVADCASTRSNVVLESATKINNHSDCDQNRTNLCDSNSKIDIIDINYEEQTEVDNKSSNDLMNGITKQEESTPKQDQMTASTSSSSSLAFLSAYAKGSDYNLKSYRRRDKLGTLKNASSSSNDVEKDASYQQDFQSILGKIAALGHNKDLAKGPNESLLLVDYVTWGGANPNLTISNKSKPKGSDPTILKGERLTANGSNSDLCKGPQIGLAKGSIYANLNSNIKCN